MTKDIKLKQFNDTLGQFFIEIKKKFPDSKELKDFHNQFIMCKTYNLKCIEIFMESMKPFGKSIMEKDNRFIFDSDFSKQLNLELYYNNCNKNDKNTIWSYLQTLYLLGCSYENYTPEFLSTINNISKRCEETDK